MTVSLATALALGLLLGMRHALDPDHLAAVSTLITRQGSPRAGLLLGALWGVGHSASLFLVGAVLAALDAHLPPLLSDGFELLVAGMLLALGARAIARAARDRGAGAGAGVGAGGTDGGAGGTDGGGRWTVARQPIVIGLIHGLAGSGALTALALASLPTWTTRLLYIALFGVGSIAGMAVLTGIAGWPLSRLDRRGNAPRWLSATTGACSVLLGAGLGWSAVRALLGATGS